MSLLLVIVDIIKRFGKVSIHEQAAVRPHAKCFGHFNDMTMSSNGKVSHCGREDVGAVQINPYTFYFQWCGGNDQVWTLCKDGWMQVAHAYENAYLRHPQHGSDVGDVMATAPKRVLEFTGGKVEEEEFHHAGHCIRITWLNPDTFIFSHPNSQMWTYDVERDGYMQIVSHTANAVWNAKTGNDGRFYPRK
ncbi:hypothetical protein HDU67_001101 [Dinochytrium kinnereticum]|nr:hypothetical protein HDU67_001101 [Dinochytrium kinnereticum]